MKGGSVAPGRVEYLLSPMPIRSGGLAGPGASMNVPHVVAVGHGHPGMNLGMVPAMMQQYRMGGQRQPRHTRQRIMGPGGRGKMQTDRGGSGGHGREMENGQQFKYTANARNANMGAPPPQNPIKCAVRTNSVPMYMSSNRKQQAKMNSGASAPLTIEMLTSATPERQRQMVGEKLYPQIAEHQRTLAGKITDMFLEMENPYILHLIESHETLTEQVNEVMNVLREHGAAMPGEAA